MVLFLFISLMNCFTNSDTDNFIGICISFEC